jgi:hypothetical protein
MPARSVTWTKIIIDYTKRRITEWWKKCINIQITLITYINETENEKRQKMWNSVYDKLTCIKYTATKETAALVSTLRIADREVSIDSICYRQQLCVYIYLLTQYGIVLG